jgi:hypothetical protein
MIDCFYLELSDVCRDASHVTTPNRTYTPEAMNGEIIGYIMVIIHGFRGLNPRNPVYLNQLSDKPGTTGSNFAMHMYSRSTYIVNESEACCQIYEPSTWVTHANP